MSLFSKFSDWWSKNVLHHGEPDNISDITGMSESDMSKKLDDSSYSRYVDTLPGFWKKFMNSHDGKLFYKDKDSAFKTNTFKAMMSLAALLFGGSYISSASSVDSATGNDIIGQKARNLFSGFSRSSTGSSSGWLGNFFGNMFSGMSSNGNFLSSLGNSLLGFGSQYASSLLNMQNMEHLIDKQNEYNTPLNQMKRFQEAGLNPNLIYSMGSSGNQPSSGSIAPVDFDTSQRENRLARFSMQLQEKQFQADLGLKQAQMNLLNSQSEGQFLSNQVNKSTIETQIKQIQANYSNTIEQNNLLIEQKKKAIQETRNISLKNKYEDELLGLEKKNKELMNEYQEVMNAWQPWILGFDLFNKGASGIGSLGLGAGQFGKLFKNAPKFNKGSKLSPYEFGDIFSNYGF